MQPYCYAIDNGHMYIKNIHIVFKILQQLDINRRTSIIETKYNMKDIQNCSDHLTENISFENTLNQKKMFHELTSESNKLAICIKVNN